jgi:hypothetical protein
VGETGVRRGGFIVSHIGERQAEIGARWRGGRPQEDDVTAHEDDVSEDAHARDAARLGGLGVASRAEVEKILDA